jgi:hypothetical protein
MFENMIGNMLRSFGITPEKINTTVETILKDVSEMKASQLRCEEMLSFLTKQSPVLAIQETANVNGDDSGTSH